MTLAVAEFITNTAPCRYGARSAWTRSTSRSCGAPPHSRPPAQRRAPGRPQLAVPRRADLDDVGDSPDRRHRGQQPVDRRIDLLRHRIAAGRLRNPGHRLELDPGLEALPQILL